MLYSANIWYDVFLIAHFIVSSVLVFYCVIKLDKALSIRRRNYRKNKRRHKRKLRNIDDYVNEFGEGIIEYKEK